MGELLNVEEVIRDMKKLKCCDKIIEFTEVYLNKEITKGEFIILFSGGFDIALSKEWYEDYFDRKYCDADDNSYIESLGIWIL